MLFTFPNEIDRYSIRGACSQSVSAAKSPSSRCANVRWRKRGERREAERGGGYSDRGLAVAASLSAYVGVVGGRIFFSPGKREREPSTMYQQEEASVWYAQNREELRKKNTIHVPVHLTKIRGNMTKWYQGRCEKKCKRYIFMDMYVRPLGFIGSLCIRGLKDR